MPEAKTKSAATKATRDSRLFQRRSVLWPAQLKVGRHSFACQIWNMSLGGARVRVDLPIKEGTTVTLHIAGRGDLAATVTWVESDAMGLSFQSPADAVKRMFQDRLHILGLDASD